MPKSKVSEVVGKLIAERSVKKGVKEVYFDRGKYKYHGRIKLLAETAKKRRFEILIMSQSQEIKEKLVAINRITKVVKGGRRFGFAALVVVGNQKGQVGFGQGKAKQVPDAIKKASQAAKKSIIKVSLRDGRTLHHDVRGRNGAGKVLLRSAPAGTGIIAGGPVRAICEMSGIQDIVGKSIGSSNPYNLVRASFDALLKQKTPKDISVLRGKKLKK